MHRRPLTFAALGVAAVALDPRVVAWDALPDVLGWLLVAYAAWRLTVRWAAGLALAAAVASIAEAQLPYRYDPIDPITGAVVVNAKPGLAYHELLAFDHVSGPRLALLVLAFALGGAALWVLLRELAARAAVCGDDVAARRLGLLAWAVVVGWAGPLLLRALGQGLFGDDGFDPIWNGAWEVPGLIGIAVMAAVVLQLATSSNRRWGASGDELGSPWADLMVRDHQAEGY